MSAARVVTTMWSDDDDAWARETRLVDRRGIGPATFLRRCWQATAEADVLVLLGSDPARDLYRDQLAAVLAGRRRRPPRILLADATWEPRSRALERRLGPAAGVSSRLARAGVRALDGPHVHYAVLSSEEAAEFPRTWGIPAARVHHTPYCHTLWDGTLERPVTDEGYLFAGGNSLRDYDLLADAVRGLGLDVRVAARWQPASPVPGLAAGPVAHDRHQELLRGARAVVVPLRDSVRSAGQQTYLNAMALGKPVVVVDAKGVRDHITPGVTGTVVAGEAGALRQAITHVMSPAGHQEALTMAATAREDVFARFTPVHYRDRLLALAREVAVA